MITIKTKIENQKTQKNFFFRWNHKKTRLLHNREKKDCPKKKTPPFEKKIIET